MLWYQDSGRDMIKKTEIQPPLPPSPLMLIRERIYLENMLDVSEVLFRILLASLDCISISASITIRGRATFAGFPTFCPMTFHLLASYSLIASRSAMDCQGS